VSNRLAGPLSNLACQLNRDRSLPDATLCCLDSAAPDESGFEAIFVPRVCPWCWDPRLRTRASRIPFLARCGTQMVTVARF
jgi:hypothetical protein